MAKAGNHGIIIPRDRALLYRLYWVENKTLPEIGAIFDVTHKSVQRVFRQLDIPSRRLGPRERSGCMACGASLKKIRHASNGALYGHCAQCRRKHRNELARKYVNRPERAPKRREQFRRWYLNGPLNPRGEEQWIRKSKHLLRSVKRLLSGTASREA